METAITAKKESFLAVDIMALWSRPAFFTFKPSSANQDF